MNVVNSLKSIPLWLVTKAGLITTGIALAALYCDSRWAQPKRAQQLEVTAKKARVTSDILKLSHTCRHLEVARNHLKEDILLKPFHPYLREWHAEWHALWTARELSDRIEELIDQHKIQAAWDGKCKMQDAEKLDPATLPLKKEAGMIKDTEKVRREIIADCQTLAEYTKSAELSYFTARPRYAFRTIRSRLPW